MSNSSGIKMDDRELLELAAKGAGYTEFNFNEDLGEMCVKGHGVWCPLSDDGEALRLAVKLEIFISRNYDCIVQACSVSWNSRGRSLLEPAGDDPYAATRRAIVRAAAEIGRTMP